MVAMMPCIMRTRVAKDEVYMRDRDDCHNSDKDDELSSDGGDEHNNDGRGEHNNDGDDGDNNVRGGEFKEFANPEEYDDFVKTFTVPSAHCQPSGEPPIIGSSIMPYSLKAPEFTADDVVKEEQSHYPSHSTIVIID